MLSGPAACAFDSDDDCVVEEPVEEGRRDDGVSEDVAPFREASVRCGDHRAFFVSCICDLEEQACSAFGDGQATDFIDDEQRGPSEEADFFGEPALAFGFGEAVGGFCERGFVDAFSGFDGGDAECRREVGLSGSGRSEEVDGFASPDEVEPGQRGDSLAVERGLECEVEAFDRLDGEEFRGSQCDVYPSCFAQGAILAEEGVDGFDGCGLALLQPLQRGAERFERPGHFQSDQGGADAVDEFGHRAAPCRSRRRPTASWKARDRFGASSSCIGSGRGGGLRWSGSTRRRFRPSRTGCRAISVLSSKIRTSAGCRCTSGTRLRAASGTEWRFPPTETIPSRLAAAVDDPETRLPETVRGPGRELLEQIGILDAKIGKLDAEARKRAKESGEAKRLTGIPGIGPVCAMATQAFAPPMEGFRRGRDFPASARPGEAEARPDLEDGAARPPADRGRGNECGNE